MKIRLRSIQEIDAGKMRTPIRFLPPTQTNFYGNTQITYDLANAIDVMAVVHPGGNARQLQEAGLTFDNIVTMYVRYIPNLDNNWKIVLDGFDYYIHKTSDVDHKQRYYQILAYSKQAH